LLKFEHLAIATFTLKPALKSRLCYLSFLDVDSELGMGTIIEALDLSSLIEDLTSRKNVGIYMQILNGDGSDRYYG
jgi:hypothetical protein